MGVITHLQGRGQAAARLVSAIPVLVLLGYPLLAGSVDRVPLGAALIGVALLLALPGMLGWWQQPEHQRLEDAWRLGASLIGIPIAVVFVVYVVTVPESAIALTMAVVLIGECYLSPARWQVIIGGWTVVGWTLAVHLSAAPGAAALWMHGVTAALVLVVTLRTSRALSAALLEEEGASRAARRQVRLIGRLLAADDLDPTVVLRAARQALHDLGFEVVVLRRYDADADHLVLLSVDEGDADVLPRTIPLDRGPYRQVVRARTPAVLHEQPLPEFLGAAPRGAGRPASGVTRLPLVFLIPVLGDGGQVQGVVSLASLRPDEGVAPLELVTSLIDRFAQMLARARAFRADGEVVELLRELEERSQDIVATVSHELRTPLTVIDGLAGTLALRWEALGPADRVALLTRIESNADRLQAMIGSLLSTSACERGELTASMVPVRLEPLCAELVARLSPVIADRCVRVEVDPGHRVMADVQLLLHVLENLLSNAVKHTPPGTPVRIWSRRQGRTVTLAVSDGGPGIPAEELPHVQERFYRGGNHLQRETSGLGLGLALVQRMLEAQGTGLHLRNDGGLTACVELVAAAAGPGAARPSR